MGGGTNELQGPDLEKGVPFADLEPEKPFLGHAHGENVVVVRVGDDVHAIGASCTHYSGPLQEGFVQNGTIRCPWHHACFDLKTGDPIGAPALAPVACFEVVRAGDLVQVRSKKDAPTRTPKVSPASVVMVGAGAAAAACAEQLRREGYKGPITMFGAEGTGPVDRPNLSKDYLAGTAPEEWIPIGSAEHWSALEVEIVPDDPVTEIDPKEKKLTTQSGRTASYDALLLAMGAEPRKLTIPGADGEKVFTLRSLADSRKIIEGAKDAKSAVVIGASFIGLEVAASLVARGIHVEVCAPEDVPFGRILGPEVGAFIKGLHEAKGVKFHLGAKTKSIEGRIVTLSDDTTVEGDLIVIGVGVTPRLALAEAAGLTIDNGIVVDEMLKTSTDGIWAAGDVAHYPDPRVGSRVRIEHWVVAERQGQAAARSMLGVGKPYNDVPFFWSAHYDVTLAMTGHAPGWDNAKVYGSLADRDAAIAYSKAGKVLAVATINRDQLALRVEAAMERLEDPSPLLA